MFFHRLLVERIFAQYMVPHNLETTERMKCLYYLYATLDLNAVKYVSDVKLFFPSFIIYWIFGCGGGANNNGIFKCKQFM